VKALPHSFAARAHVPVFEPLRTCAPADPEDAKPVARPCRPASGETNGKLTSRFSKTSKLLRRADFQRVYKQGRRHFAAHMTVFYLRRDDVARPPSALDVPGNRPRVGLTVGRVLGGAVDRNRIKRRLREAVRYHLAALAVGVDVVINPKKSALKAEFNVLQDEVARAFRVIGEKESRRG
jgi:ribonuclease P protein component